MNTPNIETDPTAHAVAPAEKATSGTRKPRVAASKPKSGKKATSAKKAPKGAKAAKTAKKESGPREGSKTEKVLDLLKRSNGATIAELRGRCSQCRRPAPGYDRLPERSWLHVPLWAIPTFFRYAPAGWNVPHKLPQGSCWQARGGVNGARFLRGAAHHVAFLARWARRLSWREVARVFQTSWQAVYRSVEWFVEWGLAHRQLHGVESIGVDEIHWGRGLRADNFLTVIYQIDAGRAFAVGGETAVASHPTPGAEGARAGGDPRIAFCVQRYVETPTCKSSLPMPVRLCTCWIVFISPAI